MTSVVQICNMALMRIGCGINIASLTEGSTEANACALFYEHCRDFALRDYPWPFASRRVALGLLTGDAATNWAFKYAYPSDCLQAREIVGAYNPRNDEKIPFEVANEGTSRVIYTNQEDAELLYTVRVEDTNLFDPIFVSALASLLASELVMPLSMNPTLAVNARNSYIQVSSAAAARAFNEGFTPEPECELLSVRGLSL